MSDDKEATILTGQLGKSSIGEQIRYWRGRSRISQMDLALECDTSSRHLSFVETGRAHPSRKLLLALIQRMEVPLRSRNTMLITAGYAPIYEETGLSEPEMDQVRTMLNMMVQQNGLFPSMLIDRHWNILESNLAFDLMCQTFAEDQQLLLEEPLNLVRCFLNPRCLGNAVVNYREMYEVMMNRARRFINVLGIDKEGSELMEEVLTYQPAQSGQIAEDDPRLVMPLRLKKGDQELSLFTMVATMGAPLNITLQEIQLEFGLPVDAASENFLRAMVRRGMNPEIAPD
jgi:transcriptional regulator with XRE-family HTH domain